MDEEGSARKYLHQALIQVNKNYEKHIKRAPSFHNLYSKIMSFQSLGTQFLFFKKETLAEKLFLKFRKLVENQFGVNHLITSDCYASLSAYYLHLKDFQKSLYFCEQTIRIRTGILQKDHDLVADSFQNKAYILFSYREYLIMNARQHEYEESKLTSDILQSLFVAREIRESVFSVTSLEVLEIDILLHQVYCIRKQFKEMYQLAKTNYKTACFLLGRNGPLSEDLFEVFKSLHVKLFDSMPELSSRKVGILNKNSRDSDGNFSLVLVNENKHTQEAVEVFFVSSCLRAVRSDDLKLQFKEDILSMLELFLKNCNVEKLHRETIMDLIGILYPKEVYSLLAALSKFQKAENILKKQLEFRKGNTAGMQKRYKYDWEKRSIVKQLLEKRKRDQDEYTSQGFVSQSGNAFIDSLVNLEQHGEHTPIPKRSPPVIRQEKSPIKQIADTPTKERKVLPSMSRKSVEQQFNRPKLNFLSEIKGKGQSALKKVNKNKVLTSKIKPTKNLLDELKVKSKQFQAKLSSKAAETIGKKLNKKEEVPPVQDQDLIRLKDMSSEVDSVLSFTTAFKSSKLINVFLTSCYIILNTDQTNGLLVLEKYKELIESPDAKVKTLFELISGLTNVDREMDILTNFNLQTLSKLIPTKKELVELKASNQVKDSNEIEKKALIYETEETLELIESQGIEILLYLGEKVNHDTILQDIERVLYKAVTDTKQILNLKT